MVHYMRQLLHAAGAGSPDDHEHYSYVMPIVAIFVIFILGLSGSLIPPLINVYAPKFNLNERFGFRFFNGLAAGLVLGVGYIHSFPDSVESFTDAFPGEDQSASYAWGGLCAMVGALATFFAEEFVHRNIGRFGIVHGHHHDHDHKHTPESIRKLEESNSSSNGGTEMTSSKDSDIDKQKEDAIKAAELGYFTELYVLLFGLSFHSLFVGIALGVSGDDWGLFAAIVFHQFFEGLALGARVARAGFRSKSHIWFLDLCYAVSAPVGIAIGIGIHEAIAGDAQAYSAANGIFQGLSTGILVYVAMIHMMKEEMDRPEFKNGGPLLYIMYAGFLAGAGAMAVIGIWA